MYLVSGVITFLTHRALKLIRKIIEKKGVMYLVLLNVSLTTNFYIVRLQKKKGVMCLVLVNVLLTINFYNVSGQKPVM